MLLNKAALIATLTVFINSGCVSTNNEAQQAQIISLQSKLIQTQETNLETQVKLINANKALKISLSKEDELTISLEKAKQIKKSTCTTKTTKTTKSNNKTIKLDNKTILGQTEWVYLSIAKKNYKARIDTGAETSSLNAVNIERFERDGKKWVRFNLLHEKEFDSQIIEAKIDRFVRILQSNNSEESSQRPVIKLHVRIGDVAHQTEFTLADRTHMEYPILIGRSFIKDVVLIDVSQEYIHPKFKTKQ